MFRRSAFRVAALLGLALAAAIPAAFAQSDGPATAITELTVQDLRASGANCLVTDNGVNCLQGSVDAADAYLVRFDHAGRPVSLVLVEPADRATPALLAARYGPPTRAGTTPAGQPVMAWETAYTTRVAMFEPHRTGITLDLRSTR